jgi:hypothetical protein
MFQHQNFWMIVVLSQEARLLALQSFKQLPVTIVSLLQNHGEKHCT